MSGVPLNDIVRTVLLVEEYFQLVGDVMLERILKPLNGIVVSQFAVHLSADGGPLHQFGSVKPGQLT